MDSVNNATLVKALVGLVFAGVLSGATCLGSTVNAQIDRTQESVRALESREKDHAYQHGRIEVKLEEMSDDLKEIKKLLEPSE